MPGLIKRHTLPLVHGHGDQLRYPDRRLARPLEQEGVVRQLGVGGLESRQHARHRHARRALDVVVEGAVLVAVLLQEPEGVLIAEVLELDEGVLSVPVIYPFLRSNPLGMVS